VISALKEVSLLVAGTGNLIALNRGVNRQNRACYSIEQGESAGLPHAASDASTKEPISLCGPCHRRRARCTKWRVQLGQCWLPSISKWVHRTVSDWLRQIRRLRRLGRCARRFARNSLIARWFRFGDGQCHPAKSLIGTLL
jgi:hypothetical protein